ncbi:ATP-binding protein [Embleya sp. NPDC008237]|uniref:ATP-binding protein n=1 Tax=Embleya sp. NPDC008237 TaxID=3363978 RepID=UPI0036ED82E2
MADIRAVGWAKAFPVSGGVEAGRRWARNHLASLEWTKEASETVDDVILTVSELITNAHVHAHSTAQLVLAWDNRCLNVYVSDSGPGTPMPQETDTTTPSGRGLTIVDAVADELHMCSSRHGKAVSACFHPPGHPNPHGTA